MATIPSALDLFLKYHDRYTAGISMDRLWLTRDLTDAGRFYLRPMRGDAPLGFETVQLGYPYVDVLKAGLRPGVDIKPELGVDPNQQLEDAYWKRIRAEYLEGRRFFLHLHRDPVHLPRWYSVPMVTQPMFPARFRIWPLLKRGMVINPEGESRRGYLHWSAFVPEGTPEHAAIAHALDIGHLMRKPLKPNAGEIAKLHDELHQKLALVPA